MPEIRVTIGGAELKRALADPMVVAGPVRDFLYQSAFTVEAKAKLKAPVDTGRLRSSIASQVNETQAIIGSNVAYAPYVEFGTRPHWPPQGALQPWAQRHGFPAGKAGDFLVRRAISRRGTRAHPYLIPALRESVEEIRGFLTEMGEAIKRRFGS